MPNTPSLKKEDVAELQSLGYSVGAPGRIIANGSAAGFGGTARAEDKVMAYFGQDGGMLPHDASQHPDFDNDASKVYWPGTTPRPTTASSTTRSWRWRQDPLSTFSIDVDTASYANVRRFLEQRHRCRRRTRCASRR